MFANIVDAFAIGNAGLLVGTDCGDPTGSRGEVEIPAAERPIVLPPSRFLENFDKIIQVLRLKVLVGQPRCVTPVKVRVVFEQIGNERDPLRLLLDAS